MSDSIDGEKIEMMQMRMRGGINSSLTTSLPVTWWSFLASIPRRLSLHFLEDKDVKENSLIPHIYICTINRTSEVKHDDESKGFLCCEL